MPTFVQIGKQFTKIDTKNLFLKFLNQEKVKDAIIKTLRRRLFLKGLIKNKKKVHTDKAEFSNVYSTFTIINKKKRGLPTNRVTLFQSGSLYDSFKILVKSSQLQILADFKSPKYKTGIYKNFQAHFTDEKSFYAFVMSLTEKEINLILQKFLTDFKIEITKQLLH